MEIKFGKFAESTQRCRVVRDGRFLLGHEQTQVRQFPVDRDCRFPTSAVPVDSFELSPRHAIHHVLMVGTFSEIASAGAVLR